MYQKIMVPLDGSKLAECDFPHLSVLAGGCKVNDIVLIRVVEPFYQPSTPEYVLSPEEIDRVNAEMRAAAEDYLGRVTKNVKFDGLNVRSEILTGRAAEVLADYATQNEVDLIIIATHGRSGVSRWVWGSVADRILRSACVQVLMVRAPGCMPGI
jgi:nucleotide-binding universal stress UspA family protein